MKRQWKSCRKGCSQAVLSTSGLSSGLSITTVCSPATVHNMLNSGDRASAALLHGPSEGSPCPVYPKLLVFGIAKLTR